MRHKLECNEATKRLAEILQMQTEFEIVRFTDTRKALSIKLLLRQKIDRMLIEIKPTFTINGKEFPISKLQVGGMTKNELNNKLLDSNILMNPDCRTWLDNKDFPISTTPEIVKTVIINPCDLGFDDGVSFVNLYKEADKLGLTLCSDETAVYQQFNANKAMDTYCIFAMKHFVRSGRQGPWIFCTFPGSYQLGSWYAEQSDTIHSNAQFMFQIKKEVDND